MRMYGFFNRNTSEFSHVSTLFILYKSLVRPRVEYRSIVWSPFTNEQNVLIEKPQHKFSRYAAYHDGHAMSRDNHDHSYILRKLNLQSLQERRLIFNLTFLFKIITNFLDSSFLTSHINYRISAANTRNSVIFHVHFKRTIRIL